MTEVKTVGEPFRFLPSAQSRLDLFHGFQLGTELDMTEGRNDDHELLRQIAKGNEPAFNEFYQRYQGRIYRFVWHMSMNHVVAEEITQEVFMTVITRAQKYDSSKGSVVGYLFGIARNLARRSIQYEAAHEPITEEFLDTYHDDATSKTDLLAELSHSELVASLQRAVLTLPELYREIVVLCALEEVPLSEAAELLESSPGTLASRLHRAKAILRKKLGGAKCTI